MRLLPTGEIDTAFGVDGIRASELADEDRAKAVAIGPDRKPVVVGYVRTDAGEISALALRVHN